MAGDNLTGANMYAYCNGNPVMCCDPSGMASEWIQGMRDIFALLQSIATSLGRVGEWIALTAVIFAEASSSENTRGGYFDEYDKYIIWRVDQLAVASIIMNRRNDTTGEYKNQNTFWAVISASGQFTTFDDVNDSINTALRGESASALSRLVNAGVIAFQMQAGAFDPLEELKGYTQFRGRNSFEARFTPYVDSSGDAGIFDSNRGPKAVMNVIDFGGNYYFMWADS